MSKKDKRVDAYIANARPFARPILTHLRTLVHTACPETEETIKWGFPHFDFLGEMMCSMAAFTQHCSFGFWKASLMKDKTLTANAKSESAMGHFGRITAVSDLPSDRKIIAYIREAAALNAKGIKIRKAPSSGKKKELIVPEYFSAALKRNKKALATFDGFSFSQRKEYVQWIVDAKTEETRDQRLATAVEWMADGKVRNWKYLKK